MIRILPVGQYTDRRQELREALAYDPEDVGDSDDSDVWVQKENHSHWIHSYSNDDDREGSETSIGSLGRRRSTRCEKKPPRLNLDDALIMVRLFAAFDPAREPSNTQVRARVFSFRFRSSRCSHRFRFIPDGFCGVAAVSRVNRLAPLKESTNQASSQTSVKGRFF